MKFNWFSKVKSLYKGQEYEFYAKIEQFWASLSRSPITVYISGCSAWLFTIAIGTVVNQSVLSIGFAFDEFWQFSKKNWYFDFFLSGEKVRNERSQR